ncbi:pentatricopeptide repeat-containing protein ELI1, chloroplastic-like [Magnolia sinica]|uniref:pentatricopeptide repeat-containing protein ELI1, chloroplastic-like n=1 Tax=Magnolia sinica TaxID=86752 RepID=UPI002657E68B|nr:pentatricopeptide repeat-containing protein ELI1, chloroplastic-like [Magnolia sinica]
MRAFVSHHNIFKSIHPFCHVVEGPHSPFAWISSSAIRNASSPNEALHFYTQMHRSSITVDSYTALYALKSCACLSNALLTRHVHAHLFKINLESHIYVATALLNGYVASSFSDACQLFDEMPNRNIVTWNTMISGYSKKGEVKRARWVFDSMPARDVASWSAMISGYMGAGLWSQGLELFKEMMVNGALKPDNMMLVTLLSGCSHMGSLPLLGKSIHAYAEKNGIELNVVLGTALVDMYAKCGFLKNASWIFERLHDKNVMSWSAMICGLALHGHGEDALCMFERMKVAGMRPNEITYTGILNACSHAGLVDKGCKNFYSMIEEFGLEPGIQHYGCMVDLLGKAGLLEEAYELIKTMKLKPNIIVWCSFLAGCKMHRNFEMAERAAEQVLNVADPDKDGGVFTLISDLYASNGKWDDMERVRKVMDKRNVKKSRGSSFIECKKPRQSIRTLC